MSKSFTKVHRSNSILFGTVDVEWFVMKISMAIVLCTMLLFFLFNRTDLRFSSGLCNCIDCKSLSEGFSKWVIALLLVLSCCLYIFEIFMIVTTFLIFAIALLICAMEESTGMRDENGLLSLVFFAQFLAYAFDKSGIAKNVSRNRVQFPLQVIAAVYFLSGIAKLRMRELDWFTTDAPYFALEVLRKYMSDYVSSGSLDLQSTGIAIATWWTTHLTISKLLLASALILELSVFVLLTNKRITFVYACFLTSMHIGIYFVLHIFYPSIMLPMLIFAINPIYQILQLWQWFFKRITGYYFKFFVNP